MSIEAGIRSWIADVGQAEVARVLGKDRTVVSKILNGEVGVRFSDLDRLAEAAGLRILGPGESAVPTKRLNALMVLAEESIRHHTQEVA